VVEAVANAEEALYQAGQYHFDLAIIDLGLPGMGGLDLITPCAARTRPSRSSSSPPVATGRTRSRAWPPVPTTIWSSRSSSKSWKRA
jgi:two-component system response regulator PhoP